jgi:hypothetical protein
MGGDRSIDTVTMGSYPSIRAGGHVPEQKGRSMTRRIAQIVKIGALVLVLAAVPATLAVKASARQGGPGGGSTGARLSFDPPAGTVGQQYHVNGSGFSPNTWVTVGAHYSDTTWWASGQTDNSGGFSFTLTATSAGLISHEAKEMGRNGRLRLRATATYSVNRG